MSYCSMKYNFNNVTYFIIFATLWANAAIDKLTLFGIGDDNRLLQTA